MKRGKYEAPRAPKRHSSKKTLAMLLSLVLLIGCVVGDTLAWLTAKTEQVTNTFSTSDIGVQLKETTNEYKMIPGWDIAKDPKAWITEGSEEAFLFVKVEKSANFDSFMTYTIADGWTELTSAAGTNYKVYYREVTSAQMGENNAFTILKDNKVAVNDSVTKEMMTAEEFTQPTLTFTAYAHQLYQNAGTRFDAAAAWSNLNPSNS